MKFWRRKFHGISDFFLWIFPLFRENLFFLKATRGIKLQASTHASYYIGICFILRTILNHRVFELEKKNGNIKMLNRSKRGLHIVVECSFLRMQYVEKLYSKAINTLNGWRKKEIGSTKMSDKKLNKMSMKNVDGNLYSAT